MVASHNPRLVALSVFISILAAYAARDLSERVRDARGWAWLAWLVGGATACGIGTWSMHFTGMLAYRLPVPMEYDWPTALLSLLMGIIGAAAALSLMSRSQVGWIRALAAGIFFGGVGVSGLHYTAMASMRLRGMHHHSPALVTLSVVLAIAISFLALSLIFLFRDDIPGRRLRKNGSALLLGAVNPVMHYTAMDGVSFTYSAEVPDLSHAVSIASLGIIGISIVPVMVLVVALLTSLVDRLQKQTALLDELFEQAPQAVALMSADNRVVRVNREFTRLFGYSPPETIDRSIGELIVPDELRAEEQRYTDLVARGQRVDVEGVRQRKDGSRLRVSILRVPVAVPGGKVEIYAIYRDITERERAEVAMREFADRLQTLSRRLLEVQEAERRHLARELHDDVGQSLTGLRMLLKLDADTLTDAARIKFEQARGIIDELLERIRRLSFDLRPAALDSLGLLPALLALFERYTEQTGVKVALEHEGLEQRFAPQVETTAYRIVQEALTNVARHAGVYVVTVRVWANADTLSLQIEDRGRGFDPEVALASPQSIGLAGMHERVMLLHGHLTIQSRPGAGTQLTAELPLHGQTLRETDDHIHHLGG
jgi:PAS domain S-box-containing protein